MKDLDHQLGMDDTDDKDHDLSEVCKRWYSPFGTWTGKMSQERDGYSMGLTGPAKQPGLVYPSDSARASPTPIHAA